MPGVGKAKTYSERLRMGVDCDEVYPGIIIGKEKKVLTKVSNSRKIFTAYQTSQSAPKV